MFPGLQIADREIFLEFFLFYATKTAKLNTYIMRGKKIQRKGDKSYV